MSLQDIKARAEAATAGPWHVDEQEQTVRATDPVNGFIMFDRSSNIHEEWEEDKVDAEFIAHARTDIPKLVAALEAVTNYVREWGMYPIPVDEIKAEIEKALA